MPAKWKRVVHPQPVTPGQIQVVSAKSHMTVFMRKSSAEGAGRQKVKDEFSECAKQTRDIPERTKRNTVMQTCMDGKGLKTGQYTRKSRGKYGLKGKVYVNGVLQGAPA
jgi:hypothetical protein